VFDGPGCEPALFRTAADEAWHAVSALSVISSPENFMPRFMRGLSMSRSLNACHRNESGKDGLRVDLEHDSLMHRRRPYPERGGV
jgi:hypothetical protein